MSVKDLKITEGKIDDLNFSDLNPVKRSKRGKNAIRSSLDELGTGRSVFCDENNNLIAGNGTTEAAKELGYEKVIFVEPPDRKTLIVVKRTDMTEDEKLKMAIFDNGSAKMAVWDGDSLLDIKSRGVDFSLVMSDSELDKLTLKKDRPKPDTPNDKELKYYVVVEFDNAEDRDELHESLKDSGHKSITYEGTSD